MNEIKTQATVRKDGKITVTVKLISFDPGELESVGFMIAYNTTPTYLQKRIGQAIQNAVVNAYPQLGPE